MEVYGVDLDGTLAKYSGWKGPDQIGEPIPKMLDQVKKWIDDGIEVRIFTARASEKENIPHIKAWLKKHGLPELRITNVKEPDMTKIFDDIAVQVKKNTGIQITEKLDMLYSK